MNGREAFEERFGFRAKGQFRVRGWFEIPLTATGIASIPAGEFLIIRTMANPNFALGGSFGALPFVMAAWALFCWWIVRIAHTGATCHYDGNDDEFRITDQNKHTEIFYYQDITGIDYVPIKYLNKKTRGFKVTINTKYRKVTYQFIASGKQRVNEPEDTPFFVLEQHCGLTRDIKTQDNNESRT